MASGIPHRSFCRGPRRYPCLGAGARRCREMVCSAQRRRLNARPSGLAPVAFHLRHIVRSLDRLLTYAEGGQLTAEQMTALKSEIDPNATTGRRFSRNSGRDFTMRCVAFGILLQRTSSSRARSGEKLFLPRWAVIGPLCRSHPAPHRTGRDDGKDRESGAFLSWIIAL